MATITSLSGDDGPLTKVTVPLKRGEQHERLFYATERFMRQMNDELPAWVTGVLRSDKTPKEQMDVILHKWISGKLMRYSRMLNDLTPREDEVWEMKTEDLRIFGWIYRPRVFVADLLGYTDWYKGRAPKRSYEDARETVIATRNSIDLDSPKFTPGVFDALV